MSVLILGPTWALILLSLLPVSHVAVLAEDSAASKTPIGGNPLTEPNGSARGHLSDGPGNATVADLRHHWDNVTMNACDHCCATGECSKGYFGEQAQCCDAGPIPSHGRKHHTCCPPNPYHCSKNLTGGYHCKAPACDRCCEGDVAACGELYAKQKGMCCGDPHVRSQRFCCPHDHRCDVQNRKCIPNTVDCVSCCVAGVCGPTLANDTKLQCCGTFAGGREPQCCDLRHSWCEMNAMGVEVCHSKKHNPISKSEIFHAFQLAVTIVCVIGLILLVVGGMFYAAKKGWLKTLEKALSPPASTPSQVIRYTSDSDNEGKTLLKKEAGGQGL